MKPGHKGLEEYYLGAGAGGEILVDLLDEVLHRDVGDVLGQELEALPGLDRAVHLLGLDEEMEIL